MHMQLDSQSCLLCAKSLCKDVDYNCLNFRNSERAPGSPSLTYPRPVLGSPKTTHTRLRKLVWLPCRTCMSRRQGRDPGGANAKASTGRRGRKLTKS